MMAEIRKLFIINVALGNSQTRGVCVCVCLVHCEKRMEFQKLAIFDNLFVHFP